MSLRLVALLVALSAVPSLAAPKKKDPAEGAYQQARRGYYALKDDAARRKFRHHWLAAVQRFSDVATKYPKSPRAADALFTSAELLNDLSRVSLLDADLKAAISAYGRVVESYPGSSLADDAALALAKIYSDRLGQPEHALKTLEKGATLGKGDRARELAALYSALSNGKESLRFGPPEPVRKTAVASAKPAGKGKKEPAPAESRPARTVAEAKSSEVAKAAQAERERSAPAASKGAEAATKASMEPAVASAEMQPVTASEAPSSSEKVAEAPATVAAAPELPAAAESEAHSEALSAAFERAMSRNEAPEAEDGQADAPAETAPIAAAAPNTAVAGTPGALPGRKGEPATRLPKVALHKSDGGVTLAEQLGLKIRRVVIDPGHGGHDSGAIGRKGTMEKDVSLEVSKQVAELLRAEGLEVTLTRDDDRFVRLEDRAKFANEKRADLFISIHCNSAPNRKSRGIETYTLNTSADRYSIRLAARENASSERGVSDLQFILADLATKANTEESTRLASRVQSNLVKHLSSKYSGVKDLGTKEALFYVLLGVRMPAILIETSFLSHPEEEKRLGSKTYQRDMAQAIANGVQDFLDHRGRLAQVN